MTTGRLTGSTTFHQDVMFFKEENPETPRSTSCMDIQDFVKASTFACIL